MFCVLSSPFVSTLLSLSSAAVVAASVNLSSSSVAKRDALLLAFVNTRADDGDAAVALRLMTLIIATSTASSTSCGSPFFLLCTTKKILSESSPFYLAFLLSWYKLSFSYIEPKEWKENTQQEVHKTRRKKKELLLGSERQMHHLQIHRNY
jgi:hypothetical protein